VEAPLAITQALPKLDSIFSIPKEENPKFFEDKV